MATEALRPDPVQDSVEALSREAEQLKSKLEDERAKLNDVDCKYGAWNVTVIKDQSPHPLK